MLEVDVTVPLGALTLEASFRAPPGVTALFGRSGAGKTSIVAAIAGLLRPSRGRIVVGGRCLLDTGRGIDLPVHARRIGYVFQDGRLFPHLSVAGNLRYGGLVRRRPVDHRRLAEVVALLGIGALLDRRPGSLSGGERQRVAIGRALLAAPDLLLMDEPLAALDDARRHEILPYLERLHAHTGLPIVYVSHSIDEIVRLADTLVLVDRGRTVAAGPVNELLARLDLTPIVGGFEAGTVLDAVVQDPGGADRLARLAHAAGQFLLPGPAPARGTRVRLRVRARDVALATGPIDGISIRNRLACTVVELGTAAGPIQEVRLDAGGQPLLARLTREAARELALAPGLRVTALIRTIALEHADLVTPPTAGR